MSNTLLRQCANAFIRHRTLRLHTLPSTASLLQCCNNRQYHNPKLKFKDWSYEPTGVLYKGESYYQYFKRNFKLLWLAFKNHAVSGEMGGEQSRVIWRYEGLESINNFKVNSDEDIGGKSRAYVTSSRNNKLLFYGQVSTDVPRDGKTEKSGYCNLQLKQRYKAFNRETQMDLTSFNKLTLRVRGDGRGYIVNLKTNLHFAEMHQDLWSYMFFTRGGPYWQDISLPFSKFFLASQGRLLDKQGPVLMDRINWIGITLGDKVDGPFSLEIDSIKAEYDPNHFEEFAYEQYGGFKV